MTQPNQFSFNLVAYGLVGAGLTLSWVLNILFGKGKIGKLVREMEVQVPREQLPVFLATMNHRLNELGFKPEGEPGRFVQQGGAGFGDLGSSTHAKAKKFLEVTLDESGAAEARIALTLRFKDLIMGDTGESAYADAALAYIAYQTDSMQIVANRSFMAFSSFVLGLWTWLALIGLKVFHVQPFFGPVLVLCITNVATSLLAIFMILLKPKKVSGLWLAIIGLVTSLLALVAAVALQMLAAAS
jgi:hypothetical protein